MPKYNCTSCEKYDNHNGYFCRICGHSVQFDDKSRQRINMTYETNEKYCDCCSDQRHSGSCNPKIDRKF